MMHVIAAGYQETGAAGRARPSRGGQGVARGRARGLGRPKPEQGGDVSSGEGRRLGRDGSQADDYWTVNWAAKPL